MPRRRTKSELVTLNFEWRLFQEADGTWIADGRSNVTKRRPTLCRGGSRAEAIAILREFDLQQAIEHKLLPASAALSSPAQQLTVEEALQKYRDGVSSRKVTVEVTEATVKRYRPIIAKFLDFCRRRHVTMMLAVDDDFARAYLADLQEQGYAYATRYTEGNMLKGAVKYLIEKQLLPENSRLRFRLRKPTGSRAYCYTDDDIKRIFRRCRENPEFVWLYAIVVALAHTGLRISELRQLRWSNVDFGSGMIRIREDRFGGTTGDEPVQTTKGKRSRELPIAAPLRPVLKWLKLYGKFRDGFVFHGPKGGRIKPDKVRRALIRDVLRPLKSELGAATDGNAGIDRGRLHSFRHRFCSVCANNNVPPEMLLAWLGHQDSKLIKRYYHLHNEPAKAAMKSIAWAGVGA